MSHKALNNILNYEADSQDNREAEAAIYHNFLWMKRKMHTCLNRENKYRYIVHFKTDEILWGTGLAAVAIAFLPNFLRKLK